MSVSNLCGCLMHFRYIIILHHQQYKVYYLDISARVWCSNSLFLKVTIFLPVEKVFSVLPDFYSQQVGKPLKLQLGHHGTLSSVIKLMLMKFCYMCQKLRQVGWFVAGWQLDRPPPIHLWDSLQLLMRKLFLFLFFFFLEEGKTGGNVQFDSGYFCVFLDGGLNCFCVFCWFCCR